MRKSGIYMIQNLRTKDCYIGSSRNLAHRKIQHFSELRKGAHDNKRIQKTFNEFGEDSFIFIIIEEVQDKELLVVREQFWLDTVKPKYNILLTAVNNSITRTKALEEKYKRHSAIMKGKKATPETRRKMSEAQTKRYKDDPDAREKLRWTPEKHVYFKKILSGKNNPNWGTKRSDEFKNMISDMFSSMKFVYISPTGEEVVFRNLTKFCKENDLPYHMMRALHQGKRKEYQGWTFKNKVFVGYNKKNG